MKKIVITKKEGLWYCSFYENDFGSDRWIDSVEANSFGELMVMIGEKDWVGLINKNE